MAGALYVLKTLVRQDGLRQPARASVAQSSIVFNDATHLEHFVRSAMKGGGPGSGPSGLFSGISSSVSSEKHLETFTPCVAWVVTPHC